MNNFQTKREKWLNDVADGCHALATAYENNPDFYVFQSRSDIENTPLLIIGANPGKTVSYQSKLDEKGISRRNADDLGYGENQYIVNENNPSWKINKPILKLFSSAQTRPILEKSIIMNVVYFNTAKVQDLKTYPNGKEMIRFCVDMTKTFINEIAKPKIVLLLGKDAPKWLGIKFNNDIDIVKKNEKNLFLIKSKIIDGITYLLIHHPSKNYSFNSGDNLKSKQEFIEKHFASLE